MVDFCSKVNNVDFKYSLCEWIKKQCQALRGLSKLVSVCDPAGVISDVVLHGDTAFFLVFANAQLDEATIQCFGGKPVFDGYGRVDGLNSKSHKILMQLKPEIFGAVGKITASSGSEVPTSDIKSPAKLSDVLEAIAGWSVEQKQQLGAALGFSTSGAVAESTSSGQGPQVPVGPGAPKMGIPYTSSGRDLKFQLDQVRQRWEFPTLRWSTHPGWVVSLSILCHLNLCFQHLIQNSHSSLDHPTL